MTLRRGDVVVVALFGDFGKPRPAATIQTDALARHASLFARMTSMLVEAPDLRVTLRRETIGQVIGRPERTDLIALNRRLAFVMISRARIATSLRCSGCSSPPLCPITLP